MMNLMFQVTACKGKKAIDDTEVVENADVEKAELDGLATDPTADIAYDSGPVDDSLAAALGEAPNQDLIDVTPTDNSQASTDMIATSPTEEATNMDFAQTTPVLEEQHITETPVDTAQNTPAPEIAMAGPAVTEMTTPEPTPEVAAAEPQIDESLMGPVDNSFTETPVAETSTTTETYVTETPVEPVTETAVVAQASTERVTSVSPASSSKLRKIAETEPYKHGEGFVNAVYIARPKETLTEISSNIYGSDKTKELRKINSYLANRSPRGGDKIYYVSPNRPMDSSKTLSFYEDTGMASETYVAHKGDNLKKLGKTILGYDNAWKELWTTNSVASQGALNEGETLRYWKPVGSVPTTTLAQQPVPQPEPQMMAQNTPPPQEFAQPPQEEMLPPPQEQPMDVAQNQQMPQEMQPPQPVAQELPPPPPPQEIPPPPPAPEEHLAQQPVAPKMHNSPNIEEEPAEEGLNQDTMMTLGGVIILVALLAFVLIRKNKRKKEAEMAAIENTHVGT